MATQINMPKLGLSMKEGKIGKWLKNEGDTLKKGQALLEILTDKITNKLEAPADGILLKVVAEKGVNLPVGALLGVIGDAGEDISAILANAASIVPAKPAAAISAKKTEKTVGAPLPGGAKVKISPNAKALSLENGIDYTQIIGTGPDGRIIREDIENAILLQSLEVDLRDVLEIIPYEGMRQAIGENMSSSLADAPQVTIHSQADVTALQALRANVNSDLKKTANVSFTDLLIKAVARGIELYPKMNASLDMNNAQIKVFGDINIGVAIALENGLVVPNIKNANKKSLAEVSKEVKDFAKRSRKNKIDMDELKGGTFTISNLGGYGSVDWFTPIINPPESAILGVGRTVSKPVVVNGEIVIRPILGLSLSFDHRVIDGAVAAEFLGILIKLIEQPHKIFI